MSVLLLTLIILATLTVILSGVWVTIALIKAVWHVDRPQAAPLPKVADENTP
jgi:hypothetical protein